MKMISLAKNIVFFMILLLLLGLIIESTCSGDGVSSNQIESEVNEVNDTNSQEKASIAFIPGKRLFP
jgi:hypothetical protein